MRKKLNYYYTAAIKSQGKLTSSYFLRKIYLA